MVTALLLLVQVTFGGTPVDCVVDTGSAVTVLSQSQAARAGVGAAAHTGKLPLQGIGSGAFEAPLYAVPEIATGSLRWRDATVAVLPDESLGRASCLLGADLLGQQPVMIDWRQRRLMAA